MEPDHLCNMRTTALLNKRGQMDPTQFTHQRQFFICTISVCRWHQQKTLNF